MSAPTTLSVSALLVSLQSSASTLHLPRLCRSRGQQNCSREAGDVASQTAFTTQLISYVQKIVTLGSLEMELLLWPRKCTHA